MSETRDYVTLSELAELNAESLGTKTPRDHTFKYIDLSSVSHGSIDIASLEQFRFADAPSRARRVVRDGDVLFGTVRPQLRSHARVVGDGFVASTDFSVVRPRPDVADGGFLGHYLLSDEATRQAVRQEVGSNYPAVTEQDVASFRLPRIPLEEQRRIAEILDTIDETIQATERVIAKLWSEQVGAMEEHLATIDDQHRHRSLLDVVSLRSGHVDPRVEPYASWILVAPDHIFGGGRGRLIARVSAKAQGAISGKYQFEAGNVIYSKIRPELRKAWLATFDGLCSADMYPLSPAPGLLGGYLASVILGQRFSRFAASVSGRSSGMPKVNRRELAEFRIAVPRLEVQHAIASLAQSYERRIDTETAVLHKTIEVRKGLAADLLSGRVRTVAT